MMLSALVLCPMVACASPSVMEQIPAALAAVAGVVCICAAIPLVVEATRRVMKKSSTLTWTLLVFSLLWLGIFVCGSLRVVGILPPVYDELTNRQMLQSLSAGMMPIAAMGLCAGVVVADCLLWLLLRKINDANKVWWLCGYLFLFLFGVFVMACLAYFTQAVPGLSIERLFFGGCCASMAIPGWALGLTYKQICVIVNIYLEAGLCLVSALWLAKVLVQRVRQKASAVNYVLATIGVLYSLAYIIAFFGVVAYYPPPLDTAFDKCYNDLNRWAANYDTTYDMMNYVIFILGLLVPVVFNCLLAHFLKQKKETAKMKSTE